MKVCNFNALHVFNLFHSTGLFLYRLKTSENLKKRPVIWNGLNNSFVRRSHRKCYVKNVAQETCNFIIKKRFQHRCFPVKFAKFFGKHILKNISKRPPLLCASRLPQPAYYYVILILVLLKSFMTETVII